MYSIQEPKEDYRFYVPITLPTELGEDWRLIFTKHDKYNVTPKILDIPSNNVQLNTKFLIVEMELVVDEVDEDLQNGKVFLNKGEYTVEFQTRNNTEDFRTVFKDLFSYVIQVKPKYIEA